MGEAGLIARANYTNGFSRALSEDSFTIAISELREFRSKKIKSIISSDVLIAAKTITLLISARENNVYHGRAFCPQRGY